MTSPATKPTQIFFGYASRPQIRAETMADAATRLDVGDAVTTVPWTALRTAGRFVIDTILDAIDRATVAAFDVTDLNHNVMFEVGYAIGHNARIWLLRDETDEEAARNWARIKMLTTVGYSPFTNSQHIIDAFWEQRPDQAERTIFDSAIRDYLQPGGPPAIFYLPSLHDTDAARRLSRRVQREDENGLRVITADPTESVSQSLAWYAQQVYSSDVVVTHFCAPGRTGAGVHNARCALVSGLAHGMGKPILMLAEDDYATPIDYRDLLYVYPTAKECLRRADEWLTSHLAASHERARSRGVGQAALRLAAELKSLRIGDPVAENEAEELGDYFVETAAFREVTEKRTMVFVGRKGSGKTANLLRAAETLRADRRNLVCVIKPYSYELESVLSLMTRFAARDEQGYVIESLWKFLIYSEIANVAYDQISRRPVGSSVSAVEGQFLAYMQDEGAFMREEFAVRLESAVAALLSAQPADGVAEQRGRVAEALHEGVLRQLRELLGKVLSGRERVAVLVDNLDKAWTKSADVDNLAGFILGLLSSVGRITDEFARSDHWRSPVSLTLAVFVRSDIFAQVLKAAREPDKIPLSRLQWDRDLLLRVIEERYAASQGRSVEPGEMWTKYFCARVRGVPTADYIVGRILPRPRDLIYFCSETIAAAVNRRSPVVEERDVLSAEENYSQFAFEALQVENGVTMAELERVLFEFVGVSSRLTVSQVRDCIAKAGIDNARVQQVIDHLRNLSFLGVETRLGTYAYLLEMRDEPVITALAKKRTAETGSENYEIHPAYRSYLEVGEIA